MDASDKKYKENTRGLHIRVDIDTYLEARRLMKLLKWKHGAIKEWMNDELKKLVARLRAEELLERKRLKVKSR